MSGIQLYSFDGGETWGTNPKATNLPNGFYYPKIKNEFGVGVVMASGNYPYGSSAPAEIIVDKIVDADLLENSHISYAGVEKIDDKLMATGGRVLVCVGFGKSIKEARDRAYALCGQVHFAGKKCRSDIAYQALK